MKINNTESKCLSFFQVPDTIAETGGTELQENNMAGVEEEIIKCPEPENLKRGFAMDEMNKASKGGG